MHRDPHYVRMVLAFLLWAGIWTWLIRRRTAKLNLRTMFVILTGFALIAALAAPDGQELLGRLTTPWPILAAIVVIALLVVWVADRGG
jgi:hypothetical protein